MVIKETPNIIRVACYKLTAILAPTAKTVIRQLIETYGVIIYGSGWRKAVVNQCLEFVLRGHSTVGWRTAVIKSIFKLLLINIESIQMKMFLWHMGSRLKKVHLKYIYMWASALCTRVNGNPTPVISVMQFHYCTVSNPGTRADDAFVLKRGV